MTTTSRQISCRRWLRATAVLAVGALAATACGSSSKSSSTTTTTADPVAAAQARVASAQTAVSNAEKALTTANQQFCSAGKDYVTALDRYGKVFDTADATVGDVQSAGADLKAPHATVQSAITGVSTARTDLTKTQQELADANTALANAKSTAAGTTTAATSAPATTTTTTVVPATTVARVKQAEADFGQAASSVNASTPVAQAGITFNSAAFALEAAWLQLLAQAGCISDQQRTELITKVQEYTLTLQKDLQTAGYYKGAVDGIYGPDTTAAVKQLQTDHKLPVTGLPDQATEAALQDALRTVNNANTTAALVNVSALQAVLKVAGYWTGPVNGQWTPSSTVCSSRFCLPRFASSKRVSRIPR
jgi:hypothetical protein